ncbi:Branched-chain amino acid transport protein (AzlD) [Actinacidiphila yanglinensis]|uniref:Branched-chain amino acid transport protein (AzlD) n=1 Tax=Actinacidiphila yanglinensis TaxID=310779 RepID=A0A1H5XSU9_9ACTN|nr:AzlD domain-containing protein [Actinacidiphila yanglinensis]SEG14748.1 Branched-chain amino acid transport protein (AzlD) [Actinacidiphila yanglinensis]
MNTGLVAATAVLGAGTFAFRLAGPALRSRTTLSARVEQLMSTAVVVLLAALVATSALTEGHGFSGVARTAGVAVGGLFAWRRAPFVVVVLAAAVTAAALRLLGTD